MAVLAADAFRNAADSFLLMTAYVFFQISVSGIVVAFVAWSEEDRPRERRSVVRFVWLMTFNTSILLVRALATPEADFTHLLMRFVAGSILFLAGLAMVFDLTQPLADSFRASRPDIAPGTARLLSLGAQASLLLVVGGVFTTAL